jgi:hypothetical protein
MLKFDWDLQKAESNNTKHRVAFSEACMIFSDPFILTIFDEAHSTDEDRWISLGNTPGGKILVVIHTYKKKVQCEFVRIISSRKATKKEVRQYLERRGTL